MTVGLTDEMIAEVQRVLDASDDCGVATEELVKLAEDPSNPLYGWFEWDDREAAHQHRLNQARSLVRQVEIHVQVMAEERRSFFVSVRRSAEGNGNDRHYVPAAALDGDLLTITRRDIARRVIGNAKQLRHLGCAAECDAVEKALQHLV